MPEHRTDASSASHASRSDATLTPYLLCRAGSAIVATALASVRETMRPLPLTPLADLPSFVLGLAIVRGAPTPVVDVGALLAPRERGEPTRFVTVQAGKRLAALAFESVIGVRELSAALLAEGRALVGELAGERLTAVGALDGALLLVLEAARVLPEDVWRRVEEARA